MLSQHPSPATYPTPCSGAASTAGSKLSTRVLAIRIETSPPIRAECPRGPWFKPGKADGHPRSQSPRSRPRVIDEGKQE